MKNKRNIIYGKTLSDLNKKYKNNINKLKSYSKKEVEEVDKVLNANNELSLLSNGKWWYIAENETFYEIPKLFSFKWFANLHIAVKTSVCVLLAAGITSAIIFPIYSKRWFGKDYSSYTVACMGDSITWGHYPGIGTQLDEPYPTVLKNALGFGHVSNYGIQGSTVCSGTNSYAPMTTRIRRIERTANLIIVWGGVNDYQLDCDFGNEGDQTSETFYGALYDICSYLKNDFPNAFIMFMTNLPARWEGQMYYMPEVKNAIEYTCNKFNIPVLNMTENSGFEQDIESGKSDGVHPSQEFIKKTLVPKIISFIKSNL